MHILNAMSAVTRLKIDKPKLIPKFFPIPFSNFITLQGDAKFDSRKYSWFAEVLILLKEYFDKNDIKVVQIGGEKDDLVQGVDLDLRGKTSYRHTYDVINKSLLHLGADSFNIHLASILGKKIVGLYSNMYRSQSGPFFSGENDVICLQAPLLNGRKPSYSAQDNPKIINLIRPEEIALAILELLKIHNNIDRKSFYFGDKYSTKFIELIPDALVRPEYSPESVIHIRYDLVSESDTTKQYLYQQISLRKCVIMTDKLLDENALKQLKQNIVQVVIDVKDQSAISIVKQIEKLGIPYVLVSELPEEEIQKLKIFYMDWPPIQKQYNFTKDKLPQDKLGPTTKFKSSKLLLSQNKTYASKAHWLAQKESDPFSINEIGEFIDNADFWNDAEFYYLFN